MFECLNVGMFECWNGGLEGLGGLESLEGKDVYSRTRTNHYPLSTNY